MGRHPALYHDSLRTWAKRLAPHTSSVSHTKRFPSAWASLTHACLPIDCMGCLPTVQSCACHVAHAQVSNMYTSSLASMPWPDTLLPRQFLTQNVLQAHALTDSCLPTLCNCMPTMLHSVLAAKARDAIATSIAISRHTQKWGDTQLYTMIRSAHGQNVLLPTPALVLTQNVFQVPGPR